MLKINHPDVIALFNCEYFNDQGGNSSEDFA